jgi:F0F1-type ATP synthase epsilon subunit
MAEVKHAINGGIVECDDDTAKLLIESTMWVSNAPAPAAKKPAAAAAAPVTK